MLCSEEQEPRAKAEQYDQASKGEKEAENPLGSLGAGPKVKHVCYACATVGSTPCCCSGCHLECNANVPSASAESPS